MSYKQLEWFAYAINTAYNKYIYNKFVTFFNVFVQALLTYKRNKCIRFFFW